eukprot:304693_1
MLLNRMAMHAAAHGYKSIANKLIQMQNKKLFESKFTRNNRDTIKYIEDAQRYLRINCFDDVQMAFARIFESLDENIQQKFMLDHDRNESFDFMDDDVDETEIPDPMHVSTIFKWLVLNYPPPPLKFEWENRLRTDTQRWQEDPTLVYDRYCIKLNKINRSIGLLNKISEDDHQMRLVQEEIEIEALKGIFIRKNNKAIHGNKGTINNLTVKFIEKVQPIKPADWKAMFDRMKKELIPHIYAGMKQYTYKPYAPHKNDLSIYYPTAPKALRSVVSATSLETTVRIGGFQASKNKRFNKFNKRKNYNGRNNRFQSAQNRFQKQKRKRTLDSDSDSDERIDTDAINEPQLKRQKTDEKSMECNRCYKYGHYK